MPSSDSDSSSKRRAPRNYLARREQLRLLMMVGSLMLVIILMNEARKPKHWRWLTGPEGGPLTEAELGGDDIDTRDLLVTNKQPVGDNIPGMIVTPSFRFKPDGDLDDEEAAYRRAELDFWQQQLELLHWSDRRLLPQILKAVRDGEPVSEEVAQGWAKTLTHLDERWQQDTKQATDSVMFDQQLSDEDRGTWLTILQRLQQHWDEHLRDALAAAPDPSSLTEDQRAQLQRFQQLFDELSLAGIVDGTPIPWPAETNAWFRLIEQLEQSDQEDLAAADVPRIGFRQMYKQPDDYRGTLVRVRGQAKRAYHLRAPKNPAGIEGYYKFIIALAGHPEDPVFVYALELPEGFPEVKDLDVDKEVTDFEDVHVEFTGYFFKCAAYKAGDGIRVAPLILAKSPTWTPTVAEGDPELPNIYLLLAAVVGTAIVGTVIAAFAMTRQGGGQTAQYTPSARAKPQHFAALAEEEQAPGPEEQLRTLEDEHSSTQDPKE